MANPLKELHDKMWFKGKNANYHIGFEKGKWIVYESIIHEDAENIIEGSCEELDYFFDWEDAAIYIKQRL